MLIKNHPASSFRLGFGQKNRSSAAPPSILAGGTKITGNIQTNGDLELGAKVEGDVVARAIKIYATASVIGNITAEKVSCEGYIKGSVRTRDLHLGSSAQMLGDVFHENLTIESGAFLDGTVRQSKHEDPEEEKVLEGPKFSSESSEKVSKTRIFPGTKVAG